MILTFIGGGSVNWMPTLARDIYLLDEVGGGEIRLVDPNREHTLAVRDLLLRFNRERKKEFEIKVVRDRSEALLKADFVVCTFSPGAMDGFWNDLEIPIKYGIRQPVSMTVGPCGISAALRTVPVAHEIVTEMERVCPKAWLLNLTNPMTTVTRAMNLAAKRVKILGLCHEFHAFPRYLEPVFGLKRPDGMDILDYLYRGLAAQGFTYTVAGLNHFLWLTQARFHGEDAMPTLRDYARRHWGFGVPMRRQNRSRIGFDIWRNDGEVKLALCRRFGSLPIPGDRHLVEFLPSLCNPQNGFGMKYGVLKTTVDARRMAKGKQLDQIRRIARGEEQMPWTPSGEELSRMMRAIAARKPAVGVVNLPNRGQIANLPRDIVVETLATVSAAGARPFPSGALPGAIGPLCRLHAEVQELTVQAALNGDRALFLEALSLDPLSAGADFHDLERLVDELLHANRAWLPRF